MTERELYFNQRVRWTTRAGAAVPAIVVDIVPGKNEAQIRVLHRGGKQLLRVRLETLHREEARG